MDALAIASRYKASITLLHAIEPPYDFTSTVESTLEQMKRSCRRRLESLTYLTKLAKYFDSDIHIVHVAEKESLESEITFRGFREVVNEKIPYKNIQFDLYFDKDPFLGLSRYMENKNIGLLVITRYKRTFLESWLAKNHTRKMCYYSTIPLLIIPGV